MHNFVYLAQRRSQEFYCEPNFGGRAPRPWLRQCSEAGLKCGCGKGGLETSAVEGKGVYITGSGDQGQSPPPGEIAKPRP